MPKLSTSPIGSASGGNSSTTALTGGATFTGVWEQNDFPEVMVSCKTDASCTLYFDFSVDGMNAETFPSNGFHVDAGIHSFNVAVKGPRYFRVRVVNGSSAQSYLRLKTYYGGGFTRPNAPLNQAAGRTTNAIFTRMQEPQDEIVLGLKSGVRPWNKFGYRPDIDTSDSECLIIADNTTNAVEVLTTAETFDIAYTQANDGADAGATGATVLRFWYLDANGSAAIADHTLGSDGSDTTSFSGLGINRVKVVEAGSSQVNVSPITITSTTSGGVQAYIPDGDGVTQQALFHVPHDAKAVSKWLFINCNKLSGGGTPRVIVRGRVHNRTAGVKAEVLRYTIDTSVENHVSLTDPVHFPLSEADILYFTAQTTVDNTEVSVRFSLNVYDNV